MLSAVRNWPTCPNGDFVIITDIQIDLTISKGLIIKQNSGVDIEFINGGKVEKYNFTPPSSSYRCVARVTPPSLWYDVPHI